jgi:uncharacterized protein
MIGILSDSHDNLEAIAKAVDFFNQHKVSLVLHAGDIISPFTVKEFKMLACPLILAYGNNDGEKKGLEIAFKQMNADIKELNEVEHGGKKIALYHGTVTVLLSSLISSGEYDVVVRGHSHTAEIKREGRTLVINPGECCGYLTGKQTVALLDPATMQATIHQLNETKQNDTVTGENKETCN